MALENCKEAAALYRRKRELADELHAVTVQLEAALAEAGIELVDAGVSRLPIGGSIIHFRTVANVRVRQERDGEPLAVREPIPDAVARSLRAALGRVGLAALVKPQLNKRGLSAWVAERAEAGEPVPQTLRHWLHVEVNKIPAIRVDSNVADNGKSQSAALDEALGERIEF